MLSLFFGVPISFPPTLIHTHTLNKMSFLCFSCSRCVLLSLPRSGDSGNVLLAPILAAVSSEATTGCRSGGWQVSAACPVNILAQHCLLGARWREVTYLFRWSHINQWSLVFTFYNWTMTMHSLNKHYKIMLFIKQIFYYNKHKIY